MKKYIKILEDCALFSGISPEDILKMLDCLGARVIIAAKNQVIFSEGDPVRYMGVVLKGRVRIVKEDYYGNRSIVTEVEPSELFAETVASAGVEQMPVSVVASSDSEIMLVDCRRALYSCGQGCGQGCGFHNMLVSNLLQVVASKNLILNQKLEIISKRTTREKLMTYLLSEAKRKKSNEFDIPYNRQELADYLGVDRSAMSAEIARMREEGILESVKSRFRLPGHL